MKNFRRTWRPAQAAGRAALALASSAVATSGAASTAVADPARERCRRWTFRLAGRKQPRGRRWAVSALLGAGGLAISFLAGVTPADAIVGGTPANPAFFPYFVGLSGRTFSQCSGTVIAARWVLTAAHCVKNDVTDPSQLTVTSSAASSGVTAVIIHPLWGGDRDDSHDLALVELPAALPGTLPIQVGAPWDSGAYAAGTSATIMGFSAPLLAGPATSRRPAAGPSSLPGFETAAVSLRSDSDMENIFNFWNPQLMIGAGGPGDTTCNGDSGGPLVVSRNGVPVEVGVVDFGDQDCTMAAGFEKLSGPQLAWVASQVPAVAANWGSCPLDGGAEGQGQATYSTYTGNDIWAIKCVPPSPGYLTAFQDSSGGLLAETTAGGRIRGVANGLGIAPGTSPAVAALSTGGREIAFQASGEDTLWTVTPDNIGHDTGVKMAAGTSPAIVALPGGGYEIAFVNSDGFLRELGPDGVVRWAANGLGVAPGTSPAIAAAPLGGFEIAFQALTEGTLWTVTPDNIGHDTGLQMAAGSSPAAAGLTSGGFEVVFAGQDNYPRKLGPDGTVGFVTTGLTVAPGTSPAIAALSTGGYEIAFGAGGSSNTLWTVTDAGTATNTGAYPAENTSPAVTGLPIGGYAIAFQDFSGNLWTVSSFGGSQDTGLTMTPGSNPSITSARVGAVAGFAAQCMDVAGANPANGTQVQLYACNGTSAQIWTIADDSTIRALGKCLDVGGTAIPVRIWDCNGTGAQVWKLTATGQLVNPQSGECLNPTGSANSTPLQIAPCDTAGSRYRVEQEWFLPPDSSWTVTP